MNSETPVSPSAGLSSLERISLKLIACTPAQLSTDLANGYAWLNGPDSNLELRIGNYDTLGRNFIASDYVRPMPALPKRRRSASSHVLLS